MIGVYTEYRQDRVTQYLPGSSETVTLHAVARIEPSWS